VHSTVDEKNSFTARRYASAVYVYAVVVCPSVCLSFRHKQNG